MFPTIEAQTHIQTPPKWAVLERQLIEKMNAAGPEVLKKYTRSDGTLLWPTHLGLSEYRRTRRCL